MRENTTSSASSASTRRASSASRSSEHETGSDPPSTPPEQADEAEDFPELPAHQRDLHQKKRRRSSAIPPLNFNDPDQDYSSSPVSGSSPMTGSEDAEDESVDDDDDTAMSLVSADNTANITMHSDNSNDTSDSSTRLDDALRQASAQAGTRGIEYDEYGDMSMEMATEEITNAFQPWAQQGMPLPPMAQNLVAMQEQENVNPFSPAFRSQLGPKRPSTIAEEDDEDMSMDMTRAVGGIVGFKEPSQTEFSVEDDTMDFTQAVGKIYQPSPVKSPLKSALKRRLSTTDAGSPINATLTNKIQSIHDQMPANKRRRTSTVDSSLEDATMDFTTAIGTIRERKLDEPLISLTEPATQTQRKASPLKQNRRTSIRSRRRSSVQSSASNDETMDFTMAIGGIKQTPVLNRRESLKEVEEVEEADSEDLSMEMTTALGDIAPQNVSRDISRPVTPRNVSSPLREDPPTTPHDQDRFKETNDMSAKKLLTPIFESQVQAPSLEMQPSPKPNVSPVRSLPRKSPSPRKSFAKGPSRSPQRTPARISPSPLHMESNIVEDQTKTPVATSPSKIQYPVLPSPREILTPEPSPERELQHAAQSPLRTPQTPQQAILENADQLSPSASKHLRSSNGKKIQSPAKDVSVEATRSLSGTIKLMSTPRKDTGTTPLKRLKDMTPKTAPARKMFTPKQISTPKPKTPLTEAKSLHDDTASRQLHEEFLQSLQTSKPMQKVKLNEFLDLAGIKFMDLTTTKRRYTVAPTPAKPSRASDMGMDDSEETTLEDAVVAGACTVPELDLYQHSCRELKKYMSEGKSFLKSLEKEVYEDSPPLMRAYLGASPETKTQLDAHLRDAKTLARLQSKELWYGWRSQLLEGLEDGLKGIRKGLESDSEVLALKEALLGEMLPAATQQHDALVEEAQRLEEAAVAVSDEEKVELDETRQQLTEANEAIIERKALLESLERRLREQERLADIYSDSRSEAMGAIEEANRVKEAMRGISADEVASLKGMSYTCFSNSFANTTPASVKALESSTGWCLTSASSSTVTMTYREQLRLFFDTSAFAQMVPRSPRKRDNKPISLTYIADADEHHPSPLTTEKRFFLQLMRVQLQCLVQRETKTKDLLAFVSKGWDAACNVSETLRRLAMENMVETSILSDERLGVKAVLLLPKVQTKVHLSFEISASTGSADGDEVLRLKTSVDVSGKVVYGEQYKEGKMGDFLKARVGASMQGAEGAVRDLKARLIATGRKGITV